MIVDFPLGKEWTFSIGGGMTLSFPQTVNSIGHVHDLVEGPPLRKAEPPLRKVDSP